MLKAKCSHCRLVGQCIRLPSDRTNDPFEGDDLFKHSDFRRPGCNNTGIQSAHSSNRKYDGVDSIFDDRCGSAFNLAQPDGKDNVEVESGSRGS